MSDHWRRSHALVDLCNLEENLNWVRKNLAPGEFLCPMVKANAYGHGDVQVARVIEKMGIPNMGVALIEEGLKLRQNGIQTEIFCFSGCESRQAATEILQAKMIPVLTSLRDLEMVTQVAHKFSQPVKVHLEFDTGMARLGFSVQEASIVFEKIKAESSLKVDGIMTHFVDGEDFQGRTQAQLQLFQKAIEIFRPLSPIIHSMNSAALMKRNEMCGRGNTQVLQGARPGLCIYGLSPLKNLSAEIKPVMSLRSHILQIRKVFPGETVSYGGTWKASRPSTIGVIPLGYGDGYPRHLSNRGQILCRGRRFPVVGIVCMDYLMIDLTDLTGGIGGDQLLGEEVCLFGESGNTAEHAASVSGTIPYEIVTRVSERIPRVYLSDEPADEHVSK